MEWTKAGGTRTASWEHQLLTWAFEGLQRHHETPRVGPDRRAPSTAYQTCEQITRSHSRTFYLASGLLPRAKRNAARALYAFCRTTDDIVDDAPADLASTPREALEIWHKRSLLECGDKDSPTRHQLILAWTDVQAAYGIPRVYAQQLIDGVSRDLNDGAASHASGCDAAPLPRHIRYRTFEELAAYCYGVASTVGLMAMHIIGFSGPEAVPYAVKLGVALQLTNILRDVAEDWRAGRLYLPVDELGSFGLSEADIAAGIAHDRWRAFMRFQIDRVRAIYAESMPGIQMLHRDGRFAIGAAAELYRAILDDIEAHHMDVFSRRAHLSSTDKLRRLPGIWWRARVVGYHGRADDQAT